MDSMMNGVDPNQIQHPPPSILSSFEQLSSPFCNSALFMYHRRKSAVSMNQDLSTNHILPPNNGRLGSLDWNCNLLPQNSEEVQIPWMCNELQWDLNLPPICTETDTDGVPSFEPTTPVRRRGKEGMKVHIMDSSSGNGEICHENLLKLFTEMNSGLEMDLEEGKGDGEIADLRKTPRKKERRKKHRPKVVREAKKKAPKKKEEKKKREVVIESEKNSGVKPLRKYVRRKVLKKEFQGGEMKDGDGNGVGSCRRWLNLEPGHPSNSESFLTLSISSSIPEPKFSVPAVERGEAVAGMATLVSSTSSPEKARRESRGVCHGLWFGFEKCGEERHETDIYNNDNFIKERRAVPAEEDGMQEERLFSKIDSQQEELSEEILARITRSRLNKRLRSVSISFPEDCKKRRTDRCPSSSKQSTELCSIFGGSDGQASIRQEQQWTRNPNDCGEEHSSVDIWSSHNICFGQVLETFEAQNVVVFNSEVGPMSMIVPKKKREKRRGRKERSFAGSPKACIEAQLADTQTNVRKKKRSKKTWVPLLLPRDTNDTQLKNVGIYFDYQYTPSYSEDNLEADIETLAEKLKNIDIFGYKKEQAMVPYATKNDVSGAMVVYGRDGRIVPVVKKRKPRAKVELDEETSRVWKLLMGNINDDGVDGNDEGKAQWWENERRIFSGRADSFIARMRLVQGDRQFSPWKGSVVDSVIGVFLTQNVSDHLSSSAFMSMAAHFPLKNKGNKTADEAPIFFVEEPVEFPSLISPMPLLLEENYSPGTLFLIEKKSGCSTPEPHYIPSSEETTTTSNEGPTLPFTKEEPEPKREPVPEPELERESEREPEWEPEREPEPDLEREPEQELEQEPELEQKPEREPKSKLEPEPKPNNNIISDDSPSSCSTEVKLDKYDIFSNKTMETLYALFLPKDEDPTSPLLYYPVLHVNEDNTTDSRFEETNPEINMRCVTESEENGLQSPCEDSNGKMAETLDDLAKNEAIILEENTSQADIRFCHNSGISFQHSDNSSVVLTPERIIQSSESTSESEEKAKFDVWDSRISFMGLLQIAETSTLHMCDDMQFFQPYGEGNQPVDIHHYSGEYREYSRPYTEIMGYNAFRNSKEQLEGSEQSTEESESRVINEENDGSGKVTENTDVGGGLSVTFESSISRIRSINGENNITVLKAGVEKKEYRKGVFMKNKNGKEKESTRDWGSLRKEAEINGKRGERKESTMDSLDWEAVRRADVGEVAETIKERGMNNVLAGRIKDFLDRLVREQGSIDLEWLRDVEPDKAKEYLLSIRGLGLKSVECVRLLTLHHLAFPVDTNVGRIVVRLGWVPIQPLPESLQLHLLELYPMLETIQKYLWPRLCKLDQKTLYELHYQMITFGKVFCTKNKPNCNSCPMRGECRHFASAFASARLTLPGPEEKGIVNVSRNKDVVQMEELIRLMLPSIEVGTKSNTASVCEPIIEEPPSPEPEYKMDRDIEDILCVEEEEIPTIKLNIEEFSLNLQTYIQNNMELDGVEMSKALVALTPEAASIPMPKMKNVSRLRTEHQVYELPDSHPLLKEMDRREPDDPCSYLLAIWTPGETANSIDPPERKSESCEFGQLCSEETCSLCSSRREAESQTVRGTLLIPCRTAMRGSFPLNGTYFQVNEVFADHDTSINPIDVPRYLIWNLQRRTVYFGSSIPTIFRGLTTEGIQHCFWRGYVCVRGFDQKTRAPRPLMARLHLPVSKVNKRKNNSSERSRSEVNPVEPKESISLENAVAGETTQQHRLPYVL